jgi:hypothetical protein
MGRFLAIFGLLTVSSALALANDYTGKLLDSACYQQQKSTRGCDATSATTTFAIDVSGKVYDLDSAGNSKAAEALKTRADRSADPNKPPKGPVTAKVAGTLSGNTVQVDTIEVQ